jgi:hypothetical protein
VNGLLGIGLGPELFFLILLVGPLVLFLALAAVRARRFGYGSLRAYLRAPPRSDAEMRDAADLALKGVVFCALGVLFAPFVLVGLWPLFYGGRKLMYASMGLGLLDDQHEPDA